MELQQLRYVIAVSETLNFTRAAERCHVVQSALSHQVAALERELGVRLFLRSNRRVELTPSGAPFVRAAREVLASVERARAVAVAAAGELTGRLVVGMIPNITALDVNGSLRTFREAHPAVDLHVVTRPSADMHHAVLDRSIDIAFLAAPVRTRWTGVVEHVLTHESLVLVVPREHRLAKREQVGLDELADADFVDFPAGTLARAESDEAFAQAGTSRAVRVETDDAEAFRAAIAAGLGIGMLPPDPATVRADLATVEVLDGPRRSQSVIWAKPPSPAAIALLRTLPLPASVTQSAE